METSGRVRPMWRGAQRTPGLYKAWLTCSVFVLCYLTAELAGILKMNVPQPVWPLWPGCAILTTVLLLNPRKLWPTLIPAGLAGFVLYDLRMGLAALPIIWLILVDLAEILTAALGVSSVFEAEPQLNSIRGLTKYCLFAVILAPLVAATAMLLGEQIAGARNVTITQLEHRPRHAHSPAIGTPATTAAPYLRSRSIRLAPSLCPRATAPSWIRPMA